jgi:transposase
MKTLLSLKVKESTYSAGYTYGTLALRGVESQLKNTKNNTIHQISPETFVVQDIQRDKFKKCTDMKDKILQRILLATNQHDIKNANS